MFRLALKDFLVGKFLLAVFIAFWTVIAMGLFQMSIDIYFLVIIFGTIMASMIPIGTESKDDIEALYISLPIRRGIIVISRYISSVIIIILSFGWGVLLGFILNKYLPVPGMGLMQAISPGGLFLFTFAAILAISILIPIFIKFGFISSITLGSIVSILVTFGLIFGASYLISLNTDLLASVNIARDPSTILAILKSNNLVYLTGKMIGSFGNTITILTILVAMSLVVFISIKISIKIFNRKEF